MLNFFFILSFKKDFSPVCFALSQRVGVTCRSCVSGSAYAEQVADGDHALGEEGKSDQSGGQWILPAQQCSRMHTYGVQETPFLLPLHDSSLLPSHLPSTANPKSRPGGGGGRGVAGQLTVKRGIEMQRNVQAVTG